MTFYFASDASKNILNTKYQFKFMNYNAKSMDLVCNGKTFFHFAPITKNHQSFLVIPKQERFSIANKIEYVPGIYKG